ncbi:TraB/GumN family protein [Corynebacterium sp. CCUG 59401]|nr:TraB/GumN family protein [Corynebacterium pseudogenitalium]
MSSSTPFADSLFWSLRSPEGKESFLFGTLHVIDDTKIALPVSELEQILKSKEALFVEINPHDLDDLRTQGLEQLGSETEMSQKTASETLSSDDMDRLQSLLSSSPRLSPMKDHLEHLPAGALAQLVRVETQLRSQFFDEGTFEPETHFVDVAMKEEIPVESLESVEEQFAHMHENEDLAEALDEYYADDAFDMFERYVEQNLLLVRDKDLNSPAMVERNSALASKLDVALCDKEGLVLVGAAHLPLDHGVLASLARAGWTVRKVELPVERR